MLLAQDAEEPQEGLRELGRPVERGNVSCVLFLRVQVDGKQVRRCRGGLVDYLHARSVQTVWQ
jgi:hypothetical protein